MAPPAVLPEEVPVPPAVAAPPPISEPVPQPMPQGAPAAPPQAAWAPPPPAPGSGRNPALRIVFILIGLVGIGLGVWKILDAFHVFGGSQSSYSSSSSTSAPHFPQIDEQWLIGTWTPVSGARCATWMRFNADHTFTDEHGNSGTWNLRTLGYTGTIWITTGNQPAAGVNAVRTDQGLLEINMANWARASC
ncbi:MAG: hypothetical protein JF596_21815 [Stenotrophomonas sp.]|nr:hypothetical protein [Stenotrophomonas sp.]